jgi:gamma-glutamyl hydrolase
MTKAGAYLLKLAIEANDKGDYFPVWGVCLGYELILMGVSNYDQTLNNFTDSENHSENLKLLNLDQSKIFKEFTPEELQYIESNKPFFFNHEHGITPERFQTFPALNDFFTITSTSTTKNGTVFVGSVEAKNYPIYGVQFHPEKIPYVWWDNINVSHTQVSVVLEQRLGNFFNREARRNFHSFADTNLLNSLLIYNFDSVKVPDSFMKCYFFKNVATSPSVSDATE